MTPTPEQLAALRDLVLAARAEGDAELADWLAAAADDPDRLAAVLAGPAR